MTRAQSLSPRALLQDLAYPEDNAIMFDEILDLLMEPGPPEKLTRQERKRNMKRHREYERRQKSKECLKKLKELLKTYHVLQNLHSVKSRKSRYEVEKIHIIKGAIFLLKYFHTPNANFNTL